MPSNLLVALSGGTSQVINTSLYGFVRGVYRVMPDAKVYFSKDGIQGALKGDIFEFSNRESVTLLRAEPGSAVTGASRGGILSEKQLFDFKRRLEDFSIKHFVNIGGSGTIKQTSEISKALGGALQVGFLPKTIDNDLGDPALRQMYFNPGFPSAVDAWRRMITWLNNENLGAKQHDKVLISNVFGRDTGWLTAACACLCLRENIPMVYAIPELPKTKQDLLEEVDGCVEKHGRCLMFVTEGFDVGFVGDKQDLVGQTLHGSNITTSSQILSDYFTENGLRSRAFIPTILQRQLMFQENAFDLNVAYLTGYKLAKLLTAGVGNCLIGINNREGEFTYPTIELSDLPRNFNRDMSDFITKNSHLNVNEQFDKYLTSIGC